MKRLSLLFLLAICCTNVFSQENKEPELDTTTFKIGNNTAILINRPPEKFDYDFGKCDSSCNKKGKDIVTFIVDVGVNGYLTAENKIALPAEYSLMELDYTRSRSFGFSFLFDAVNLAHDRLYIAPGIGFTWNGYHYENNINISSSSDKLIFSLDTLHQNTKYKLRATYLEIPLMIGTRIGNLKAPLGIQFGVIGGYKIGSITKQKYQQDGTSYEIRAQENFHLSPFKFDLITRVTFGDVGLFGRYSMSTLFKEGTTLELTPFAAGITIGNFTKQRHK